MNANLPPSMDIDENNGNGASVGGLLRASRNRRNEELREISSALCIRQVYLEAIENNNFEVLPGAIYAIGFIRSYAEYLGLDGEEVVRCYKSEATSTTSKQDLTFPSLVPEHGIPSGAIVMLGLLLAAIGYGSWYFVSTKNIFVTEQVPAVPEKLASLVGEKPVATEPLKAEENPASSANAAAVDITASQEAVKDAPQVPEKTEEKPEDKPEEINAEKTVEKPIDKPAEKPAEKDEEIVEDVKKVIKTTPAVAPVVTPTPTPEVAEVVKPAKTEAPKPKTAATSPSEAASTPAQAAVEKKPETPASTEKTVEKQEVAAPEPAPKPTPVVAQTQPEEPAPEVAAVPKIEPKIEPTPAPESKPTPAPEVASVPEATPKPTPTPVPTGTSRITLRAVSDSYIQVRDNKADQLLITRLLKTGDSYQVPDRAGLSLITGNAGALEILVDGTAVPSIGPIGAVRRNVVLEAEKLKDGSAVIE
ncbi:MAG: RodZ domain-containing protein [Rhodospirillales bacterium]